MDAMRFWRLLLIVILSCWVAGCMTVATTGAQVVYNRRDIQQNLSDRYISLQAHHKIYIETERYKNTNISVTTFHGEVLLTGEIPDPIQRDEIGKIVNDIPNVKKVYNLTKISPPCSALTRVSDTWITTKIKGKLIAASDVDPSQFKIVTDNGVTYLMGIVPPEQADIAVKIAQSTDGVQSVVKVFSYLRITKT